MGTGVETGMISAQPRLGRSERPAGTPIRPEPNTQSGANDSAPRSPAHPTVYLLRQERLRRASLHNLSLEFNV